jgi:ABC-type bacteriocin/lantibiotic exporter with double-glycine peptidase domain
MTIFETIRFALSQIDRATKWSLLAASGFLTLASLLELFGIGLVFPVVQLVMADTLESQHPLVRAAAEALSITNPRDLAIAGVFGFLVLLVAKSVLSIIAKHWSISKINQGRCYATSRLYAAYLRAPLEHHQNTHTSTVLFNLSSHCNKVFFSLFQAIVQGISDLVLAFGMICALYYASPLGATVSLAIGIAGLLINNKVLAHTMQSTSLAQDIEGANMQRLLLESMRGIREVRIKACERYFFDRFKAALTRVAKTQNKLIVIGLLPGSFFEILCGVLILVVTVIVATTMERDLFLPTLALYSVAAMRLLPTAGRMAGGVNTIRSTTPAAIALRDEMQRLGSGLFDEGERWSQRGPEHPPAAIQSSIDLVDISFRYGGNAQVLSGINMHIDKGQLIGIVGESGAGKSTLAGLMLGVYQPTTGTIEFDGRPIDPKLSAYHRSVGFVPQDVFIADETVTANVTFGIPHQEIDIGRVRQALADAKLLDFVEGLPDGLNTMVGEQGVRMSGGQRQRLGIARALYDEPEILILDEATSALDLSTESQITEVINSLRGRKTIMIIAHRLSTVQNCDRIYFMKKGRIAATGTFGELQERNADFKSLVQLGSLALQASSNK